LFGRRPSDDKVGNASLQASRKGRPAAEPWPHATRWSERPTDGRHWGFETETPRAETWTAETPIQDVTPEYIEAPAPALQAAAEVSGAARVDPAETSRPEPVAPIAPAAGYENMDPRSAAALRLSAVEAAAQPTETLFGLPIAEPTSRPATPHEPAWIRVQREASEAASAQAAEIGQLVPAEPEPIEATPVVPVAPPPAMPAVQPVAAAPQRPTPEVQAATAWPPLGASWPSPKDQTAPWPAPEATVVPAAVAAQQISTPTVAEMWVQSSQEVVNRGSVRVCRSCALPVSTQARFCRRCGTAQN